MYLIGSALFLIIAIFYIVFNPNQLKNKYDDINPTTISLTIIGTAFSWVSVFILITVGLAVLAKSIIDKRRTNEKTN